MTPLAVAYLQRDGPDDVVRLLLAAGANVSVVNRWAFTPLHWLALKSRATAAMMILETGKANLALRTRYGESILDFAAFEGDYELVRELLRRGASAQSVPGSDSTLHWAVEAEKDDNLALLDVGVDVDVTGSDWPSPIVYASSEASLQVLRLLLNGGANAKSEDPETPGWTALHAACKRSDPDPAFAELLIDRGADVNAVTKISKTTPLHNAVNSAAVVQLLLRGDASVDLPDSDGKTPLMLSCENANSARVVEILLTAGADPNAEDRFGFTPLMYCAIHAHPGAALCLLQTTEVKIHHDETSTKTNAFLKVNKHEDTALHEACRNCHLGIVKLLLQTNASNVGSVNHKNRTPFEEAAAGGHTDIVAFMLERDDINPLRVSRRNLTPLLWAAWTGKQDLIEMLMTVEGTDLRHTTTGGRTLFTIAASVGLEGLCRDLIDKGIANGTSPVAEGGLTPLHCATKSNKAGVIELVLAQPGVGKNICSDQGCTPLCYAVKKEKAKSVMTLLAHQVDIDRSDNRGRTPLLVAVQKSNEEIARMLLNAGAREQLDKALEIALLNRDEEIVRLLREVGAVEHDEGFGIEEFMIESLYPAPMDEEIQATSDAEHME
ncbi:hypothetical protein KCU64_g9485, partial [Aureobasidium melanogenum]